MIVYYPLPTTICAGMHLIHSFDEKFSKLDGSSGDFLNVSGELAANLSQNVVSLASFKGKTSWFACSGILVEYDLHTSVLTSASLVRSSDDEDTIVDNLQIEVRLPNGQCVKGTQYCNLRFKIAVINNIVFPYLRATNLYHPMEIKTGSEVVAVGRLFSTGRLTSTRGIVTNKKSNLDCDKLMVSTCKITKAGIGGPLVDFSGNSIGMNFYDNEETPFLPRNDILECLRQFETRGIMAADKTVKSSPSRWPVPKPYWSYPIVEEPADPLAELSLLPMDLDSSSLQCYS